MKKIISYGILLFLMAGFVSGTAQPVDCNQYSVTLDSGPTPVAGGYKWTYEACQGQQWDISHFILESCICSKYASLDECKTAGVILDWGVSGGVTYSTLIYGYDPTTGITGFKFDDTNWTNNPACEYVWIITGSDAADSEKTAAIKPDNVECYYTVTGPAHEIVTPEFSSITIALAVLLTTPAFAYLIVKRHR